MFIVTTAAAREILAAAERSQAAELALRVAARRVADGSVEYGMGFDEVREGDEATEFAGLQVVVGAPSRPLLADTQLDYVEIGPGRFDFIFAPSIAAESASPGCGSGGCSRCS
jgi:iron-sulfur cluster assembly protein